MDTATACYNQFESLVTDSPFNIKLLKDDIDIKSTFTHFYKSQFYKYYQTKIFFTGGNYDIIELMSENLNDLFHSTKCVVGILKRKLNIYTILKNDCKENFDKITNLLNLYNLKETTVENFLYNYTKNKDQYTEILRRAISSQSLFRINIITKEINGLINELNTYLSNVCILQKSYFKKLELTPYYLNIQ